MTSNADLMMDSAQQHAAYQLITRSYEAGEPLKGKIAKMFDATANGNKTELEVARGSLTAELRRTGIPTLTVMHVCKYIYAAAMSDKTLEQMLNTLPISVEPSSPAR